MRFAGDRGIRSLPGAAAYVTDRLLTLYQKYGYTLLVGELRAPAPPDAIGICGWVQRDDLTVPDLGFGYLARYTRQGYGTEATRAEPAHGRGHLGLNEILAITTAENAASIQLPRNLNFSPSDRPPSRPTSSDLFFRPSLASLAG